MQNEWYVAVFPKRAGEPGLLIEFKTAEKEEQLEAKAQEALRQSAERGYDAEMKGRGVAALRRYGIAFCGKSVCVEIGVKNVGDFADR